MASTPEERRQMFKQLAKNKLEQRSTELELRANQMYDHELSESLIYVKHTAFKDAMKKVDEKSIAKFLNPRLREVANTNSKWNELVQTNTQHIFVNPRNRYKTILALFLYLRDTFESGTFDTTLGHISALDKTRKEKLILSAAELIDGDHDEMLVFQNAIQDFLKLSVKNFCKVFKKLTIPTVDNYDSKEYIEKQEWVVKDNGFYLRASYHRSDNPVRNMLHDISRYLYNCCSKEMREMLGHVQHTNMTQILRDEKNEVLKEEYEKRVKEREEKNQPSESSGAFSFLSDKNKNDKKKRANTSENKKDDKRPRSEPANRDQLPSSSNQGDMDI